MSIFNCIVLTVVLSLNISLRHQISTISVSAAKNLKKREKKSTCIEKSFDTDDLSKSNNLSLLVKKIASVDGALTPFWIAAQFKMR